MRGKRAKIIRKAAYMIWEKVIKYNPKATYRRVYQKLKKEYKNGQLN